MNTLPAAHPGVIEPHYAALLKTFAQVVVKQGEGQRVSDKLKGFILKTARTILAAQPNLKSEVVDQLDADVKDEFIKKLEEAPVAEEEQKA